MEHRRIGSNDAYFYSSWGFELARGKDFIAAERTFQLGFARYVVACVVFVFAIDPLRYYDVPIVCWSLCFADGTHTHNFNTDATSPLQKCSAQRNSQTTLCQIPRVCAKARWFYHCTRTNIY
jgi:hypothetical protein